VAVVGFALLLSGGAPGALVSRGPFTSDFFDAQAHALLDGRLDVDPAVAGIEGFRHDGRTQLYFGLVPSVLRLPVAAVTDGYDGRLTQLSMLAALAVTGLATGRLVWRARRWRRGDGPLERWEPWVVGGSVVAVGLASPLLFLAARPVVYHEVELWGTALTLVTLEAVLAWWEQPGRRALLLASGAALLACNARASVGGGAVAALALTGLLALVVRRVPWRQAPALALAVLAPVAVYAAVNQARFDHPTSVPFREQVLTGVDPARQATLASTGGSLFGIEFAPTALVTYLRPDGVDLQRLFPWVTFRESTPVIGDAVFDTIDRSASLPVVAPSLVALALVGVVALVRRGWRDPWWAAVVGVSTGLAATVTIAFIADRYLSDFTPTLVLLAAIGVWVVVDGLAAASASRRRLAVVGLVGLTLLGTATSTALAIQSQRLFILPSAEDRRGFVAFQYDVHDLVSGGRPPAVRQATEVGPPGPRGEVVVLDACRGLYWSDGDRWWPLELGGRDGVEVDAALRGERTVLLDAGAWRVVATGAGTTVQLSYEHDDGTVREGDPVARSLVDGALVSFALDRVNNELTVRTGDRELLVAWLVDLTGRPDAATLEPSPTPLCDDLAARLDG
jgi:hypothetical protein